MTGEELIRKIEQGIPENEYKGTDEQKETKLALYVYVTLAKMKSFDERVYWGDTKLGYRVLKQSKEDSKDINKLASKRKLTCISFAHLYKKVLNKLGIQCDVVRLEPPEEHLSNIITLRSGRRISADVQLDLFNIYTRMRLNFFEIEGIREYLNQDLLTRYLIDIGYISNENDYRNNKIEEVRKRIGALSDIEVLPYVMGSEEIFGGMEQIEVSEAYRYYLALREKVFDEKKAEKIYQIPCYRVGKNGESKDFTFCIFEDAKNYRKVIPYLYSIKEGRMLACSLETLEQLNKSGLQLGNSKFSRGGRKLKKYIEQAKMGKKLREKIDIER